MNRPPCPSGIDPAHWEDPRYWPRPAEDIEAERMHLAETLASKKSGRHQNSSPKSNLHPAKPKSESRDAKMWRQANNYMRKRTNSEIQAWLKTLPLDAADGNPSETNEWRAIFRKIQARGRARQNG